MRPPGAPLAPLGAGTARPWRSVSPVAVALALDNRFSAQLLAPCAPSPSRTRRTRTRSSSAAPCRTSCTWSATRTPTSTTRLLASSATSSTRRPPSRRRRAPKPPRRLPARCDGAPILRGSSAHCTVGACGSPLSCRTRKSLSQPTAAVETCVWPSTGGSTHPRQPAHPLLRCSGAHNRASGESAGSVPRGNHAQSVPEPCAT